MGDVHQAGLYAGGIVVGMEDEAQTAVLVGEDGMVACAHKAACLL